MSEPTRQLRIDFDHPNDDRSHPLGFDLIHSTSNKSTDNELILINTWIVHLSITEADRDLFVVDSPSSWSNKEEVGGSGLGDEYQTTKSVYVNNVISWYNAFETILMKLNIT